MSQRIAALFGLTWNPFSADVPVEALWRNAKLEEFCWRMEELVRGGGFALITGPPGTGKSVALRLLAHHLQTLPDITAGALTRPQSSMADFYRELGSLFGLQLRPHNRWAGFKTLRDLWLTHVEATRVRPVLLVDEAQEMHPATLAELRILASADFDARSILTVVLCGDGRLTDQFRREELLPIATRIRVRLTLEPLTPKELLDWLRYTLAQAGGSHLITPEVMTAMSEHALGNLRVLANIGHELLATAARRELAQIDQKLYLETFASQSRPRTRSQATPATAPRSMP